MSSNQKLDKILSMTNDNLSVIESYINFRKILKDAGFKESELSNVSSASSDVWLAHSELMGEIQKFKKQLTTFWGINNQEIDEYLKEVFTMVNEQIPLN